MTRLLMLAGAGIVGVTIAFAAYAQSGPGHPGGGHMMMMMHHGMEAMDANKDGVITRDEFLSHPSQMFDHLDANHDGRYQVTVVASDGNGGSAEVDATVALANQAGAHVTGTEGADLIKGAHGIDGKYVTDEEDVLSGHRGNDTARRQSDASSARRLGVGQTQAKPDTYQF